MTYDKRSGRFVTIAKKDALVVVLRAAAGVIEEGGHEALEDGVGDHHVGVFSEEIPGLDGSHFKGLQVVVVFKGEVDNAVGIVASRGEKLLGPMAIWLQL